MFMLVPGLVSNVKDAGLSVQVADDVTSEKGGVVVNPLSTQDQGIAQAESIFVNLLGPATLFYTPGNTEIVPGQWFLVPPGSNVWVNAATPGHKFTSFFSTTFKVQYPPVPVPGQPGTNVPGVSAEPGSPPFPPSSVTGLTSVIPSYLYQEYSDDDDLQGFVEAQNIMQQDYVDTFNAINLPIYTGPIVAGALLDWVGRGLYGLARPTLGSGRSNLQGPLNTYGCNWLVPMWDQISPDVNAMFGLNEIGLYGPMDVYLTDDDTYRRILTWHFYKADGNYFSTSFLKRRIWRFLYGTDGKAPESVPVYPNDNSIADMEQISISLGVNRNVTIRFVLGKRTVTGGAMCNRFGCNGFEPAFGVSPPWDIGTDTGLGPTGMRGPMGITMNDLETSYEPYLPLPFMSVFKQALDLGVIETPYQFNFTCIIG